MAAGGRKGWRRLDSADLQVAKESQLSAPCPSDVSSSTIPPMTAGGPQWALCHRAGSSSEVAVCCSQGSGCCICKYELCGMQVKLGVSEVWGLSYLCPLNSRPDHSWKGARIPSCRGMVEPWVSDWKFHFACQLPSWAQQQGGRVGLGLTSVWERKGRKRKGLESWRLSGGGGGCLCAAKKTPPQGESFYPGQ